MKNRALKILISALIVLSAFFFVNGLSLAEGENLYVTQPVTITAVMGKVEVLAKDALIWEEAKEGVELFEGDKIKTGVDGKAQLTLNDGSYIKLKEETTLGIKTAREEAVSQASQYELDFRVGEIMVELKKLKQGSSFKVETPTAVAAVRGTTYYMRTGTKIVDGVEKSYVELYVDSDDLVLFTNTVSGESCMACQGQGAIVYDDGTVEGPFPIPPEEQDAWKSGFDIVYDDSGGGKKGMRDVDEEGDDEGDDDAGEDIGDTTAGQGNAQEGANQDQSGEQDITGLAIVTIITDSDGDGVIDSEDLYPNDPNRASGNDADGDGIDDEFDANDNDGPLGDLDGDGVANANDEFPLDYWEQVDTDKDTIGDFEDAFPEDNTIDPDSNFNDIYGTPVTVKGYGSWEELHQAAVNALAIEDLQGLKGDIADMVDDIHARGYEAVKESIFDHQAGKVMIDHWGNRVRVESYITKPTNDQVQVLALNLRTAGPNAGISSMDFRVKFNNPITSLLTDLPWGDYMDAYELNDLDGGKAFSLVNGVPNGDVDDDILLVVYKTDPQINNYPLPEQFSLEVKNPYNDSAKFIERYSTVINSGTLHEQPVWYQLQDGEDIETYLNGTQYYYLDNNIAPIDTHEWGENWEQENRCTFIDYLTDKSGDDLAWLVGVFYLINNNGSLVTGVDEDYLDDEGILDIMCPRNVVNPLYNLEMVFFSSEFGDTDPDRPEEIYDYGKKGTFSYNDELEFYKSNRSIDVITIPGITRPYYTPDKPETPVD